MVYVHEIDKEEIDITHRFVWRATTYDIQL